MGLECPWYSLRGRATNWDLEKLVRMVDRSHAKPKEGLSGAPSGYFYPPLEGRLLAPARWILWSAPAVVPRSVVPALCFAKDGAPVVQVGIERSKACTTRPKFKSPALSQKKKRDKDGAPAKAGPSTPQGDSLCESPCSGRDDRVYFRFANRPAPVGMTEFIFALRIALLRSG